MAGMTVNTTFDAMYTASGKDFTEAREAAVADSIETRFVDYDITMYGTFTMTRVYLEFDLVAVEDPISSIDLYVYINSSDKGKMTVVYCGQGNLVQDESDYPLYLNSGVSLVVSNLNTDSGTNVLSLDLTTFPYDPKDGTSIIFALLTDNDFEAKTSSSRSINLDSSSGSNPPYLIVNDTPPPQNTGWSNKVKSINSTNVSNISGVDIGSIRGLNGVFNR
jgi:hypothetical protein